jgi:hypothetical protein
MPSIDPHAFAHAWLDAWNSHDVEGVLAHFADDADFSSPVARQLLDNSDGVLHGKAAIRSYWEEGIKRIPELHFELVDVYSGTDILVIKLSEPARGTCERSPRLSRSSRRFRLRHLPSKR